MIIQYTMNEYYKRVLKQSWPEYRRSFGMDYRERGSHIWGVYLTQDTLLMRTARVKLEEEADTIIIVIEMQKLWEEGTWVQ